VLAVFRGEREKVLGLSLEIPRIKAIDYLRPKLIVHVQSAAVPHLEKTVDDAFDRLLLPATETEIRKEIRVRAEAEAFRVFDENLRALLLAAPAGMRPVMGVDPGFRTGCKVAVVDTTGKFVEYKTIFPNEPQKKEKEAVHAVTELIGRHKVEIITIGNGTASRETKRFIDSILENFDPARRPICLIVNESGASVYSASRAAKKEFPDHDVTVRGAISIARRIQDPLSELVKIEPKSIGVGQYQHDVSQNALQDSLDEVVESCVNLVGVNVNLASEELLKYVSGLNRKLAASIVEWRNTRGAFGSREELLEVSGMGAKTFVLAAGFLRVAGINPLDNSAVHPERYGLVAKIAKSLTTTVDLLIGNAKLIAQIDKKKFISKDVGLPTLEDILSELDKPGRDPREEFKYAEFSDSVTELSDLTPGMKLEGTVTNVTNFGAFVDIGVHQDGLVHISELSDNFVDDPRKVVKVGQVVNVTVMSVDTEIKQIALSMKTEPGRKPERHVRQERPRRDRARGDKPRGGKSYSGKQRRGGPQRGRKRFDKPRFDKSYQTQRPPKQYIDPNLSAEEKLKLWAGETESKKGKEKKLKTAKPKFNIRQFMK
jgi:uncharacterized protein